MPNHLTLLKDPEITPETVDPNRLVGCFGKEASKFLTSLLPRDTPVRLVGDVEQDDRYGRLLAYVYRRADGLFVNAELVRQGFATVLTVAPNVAHTDEFVALARDARNASRAACGRRARRRSVHAVAWYVACLSSELGRKRPLARTVDGARLALFRDGGGRPVALLDRCPHRNVPLSCGRVRAGLLECCYHGWRFDPVGACRMVPGLVDGEPDRGALRASSFPAEEHDGFVWVAPEAAAPGPGSGAAEAGPFRFPHVDDPTYATVRRHVTLPAGLHACLENALDVPHTAFLHGGLFRGGRAPVEIEVVVRHTAAGVEAEYLGEPRPEGLIGRILAPEGGVLTHVDRFLLPSIAQIEYRLGVNHLVDTVAFTPVSEHQTELYAAITFHLRLPHAPVRAAVTPVVNRILAQDAQVLRRQTENVQAFGGEHFASTELDVLSRHIRRLLRGGDVEPGERRIRMRV